MTIVSLFDAVKMTSYKMNKRDKNFDGLKFWTPIKQYLENETGVASKWITPSKKLAMVVMSLPEYIIAGNGTKTIQEQNHFIIQTVRIPLTEKPSIRKIVQIALNIGQCRGKGSNYDKLLKGRTKLEDYISKKDIDSLTIKHNTEQQIMKYLKRVATVTTLN